MNLNDLLTYINNNVDANGDEEITGPVLNSVLIEMVTQINDLVGSASNLPSGYDNVISALEINNGLVIHQGIENPNSTPPASFDLGDFYSQNFGGSNYFFQYNGVVWVEIISRLQHKLRNYKKVVDEYTLDYSSDDFIICTNADLISFPNVSTSINRTFTLINTSGVDVPTDTYIDLELSNANVVRANSVVHIISDGVDWQQVNNN